MLLHRFFSVNADKVGKELLSVSGSTSGEADSHLITAKQIWDNLCGVLVEIAPMVEIPRPSAIPASQHIRFQEFIQRNSHRNTDGVRDIFLESPIPKVGSGLADSLNWLNAWFFEGSHTTFYLFAM
jgi:hypothetical protein